MYAESYHEYESKDKTCINFKSMFFKQNVHFSTKLQNTQHAHTCIIQYFESGQNHTL